MDRLVSFFDFENLSDNDRKYVENVLSTRIGHLNIVELPWPEDEIVQHEELNPEHSSVAVNSHHALYMHTSAAPTGCVDMSTVCVPGTAYYAYPPYVLSAVPPPAPLLYTGPGMTSPSMMGSPVLTTAGYMTPIPAHMMPQQMVLGHGMLQPATHGGNIYAPGMIEQAQQCGIVMQGTIIPHPAGGVIPPTGYLTHGPLTGTSSKPVVIDNLSLSGFVEQPTFMSAHVVSEPSCLTALNIDSNAQYGFQMPVTAITDESAHPVVPTCFTERVAVPTAQIKPTNDAVQFMTNNHAALPIISIPQSHEIESAVAIAAVTNDAVTLPVNAVLHACPIRSVASAADVNDNAVTEFPIIKTSAVSTIEASVPSLSTSDNSPTVSDSTSSNHTVDEACTHQQEIKVDISDDGAAELNVQESSQWPTISQMSPSAAPVSPSTPAAKAKMPTWASLLKDTASATNAIVINSSDRQALSHNKTSESKVTSGKDAHSVGRTSTRNLSCSELDKLKIAEQLKLHKLTHRSVHIQPRGLTNRGNWCYVNATLQALLACPPFYYLIKQLPSLESIAPDDKSVTVMRSMIDFVNNFTEKPVKSFEKQSDNTKGNIRQEIRCGAPFEPGQVYRMLQAIDYQAFKHGQQEDAEEFLGCILNRLHDEMVAIMKLLNSGADKKSPLLNGGDNGPSVEATPCSTIANNIESETSSGDCNENRWEQVRSRNRTVFNSAADNETSPISAIFRGQICSILHQAGQKESATLQSFFTLQLDVQNDNVKSVKDALEQLVSKESLQGYTCTKSKVEVDATQRLLLEELPPVLVLQLKWFIYDKNGGMQKYVKQVDFDIDLEIGKDLLSSHAKAKCPASHRKYKLFAVVNHIGARAIGGHYTVDVFHAGYNCWVHCDDNQVTSLPTALVTKFTAPKVPYLIFYRRIEPS